MSHNGRRFRLLVCVPMQDVVSQTFIVAHIERLPFEVIVRYEREWRLRDPEGTRVWPIMRWVGTAARLFMPGVAKALFDVFLARHLLKMRADAVLAEYGTTGAWLTDGCRKARVPLFVHFHGYDASVRKILEEHEDGYKRMFQYASGIVAVSEPMRQRLIELGASPECLYLNPYGADPERFISGSPADRGPTFVAVGRFVEKKAPYLTILAFSRVVEREPEAKLMLVGDGPLFGPCRRLVEALGISDSVELLGAQPPERVGELMRSARAFVQHSLEAEDGDSEGAPVAIIEAQMSGLPVVATRHAGIPEVVVDGATGFLVGEGDADGMAERMVELACDPELAGRMGAAARQRAEEHYTLERHLHELALMIEMSARRRVEGDDT